MYCYKYCILRLQINITRVDINYVVTVFKSLTSGVCLICIRFLGFEYTWETFFIGAWTCFDFGHHYVMTPSIRLFWNAWRTSGLFSFHCSRYWEVLNLLFFFNGCILFFWISLQSTSSFTSICSGLSSFVCFFAGIGAMYSSGLGGCPVSSDSESLSISFLFNFSFSVLFGISLIFGVLVPFSSFFCFGFLSLLFVLELEATSRFE